MAMPSKMKMGDFMVPLDTIAKLKYSSLTAKCDKTFDFELLSHFNLDCEIYRLFKESK